ncbi:hypothetical protein EG329_001042 [Mollisiaceae sp. DMI_Dod_QoI]|nr:hypothetical protein EG329_001042 [Helotiales sp. DMI_Dod_QoI]
MFRPSLPLLFRPMPVLNKLSIHKPLPLTSRESSQLLNLLTTSFRHQLDTEHPSFRTREHASGTPKPSSKSRRRSFSDQDGNHTDRHMHSVLTNPLFTPPQDLSFLKAYRDPMDVFDLAAAKGMMDTNYAKACLNAKTARIIQSSVVSVREGMKESGAGRKVLRWLISSGTSNSNHFLKDQTFADLLMEYMVAEGLQESAWKWIKKSFDKLPEVARMPRNEASTLARQEVAGPLRALVRAETRHHASADAAYMCLSRAASLLGAAISVEMTTALQPAGLYLLYRACMPQYSSDPPTESSFESFISLIPIIIPRKSDLYLAHLSLLHPTKPDPELALDYLRHFDSLNDRNKSSVFNPKTGRHSPIQLGFDTARVLLEAGCYSEMEWTMNFLSKNFPQQLKIDERKQLEQVKAEASSIELLESIGLA